MRRTLACLLAVVTAVIAAVAAPVAGDAPASTAKAADLSYFDPGNIISDAVFYDYLSMSAGDVQAFLNAKGANCSGSYCLKNYTQSTTTQPADSRCPGTYVGAANESAATIIAKVAQACGISPRVLLVTLQKESGLVTKTYPASSNYTYAMGYGCPDSTGCSGYQGLFNQVYHAAHAFQSYRVNATGYNYLAGMNNTIYYNPNTACGYANVFIANQATAGLYDYTPYVPNAAALAAGYGTGDSCSAYGNRNFWNYFTDWFGSTQSVGATAIYSVYQNMGGSSGSLGTTQTTFLCGLRNGGCFQHYQNGSIYWTPATGAHAVSGPIFTDWATRGWETSNLGYPLNDTFCGLATANGCFQVFQGGSLYWSSATGAHFVRGSIFGAWAQTGWEAGWLGYPTTDEICGLRNGGCFNHFQNGSVYWTMNTGAIPVDPNIQTGWASNGWEAGPLGYPIAGPNCGLATASGCFQRFQGGTVYWSSATGAHFVRGSIAAAWAQTGWEAGWLGYPTTDETCGLSNGGCYNRFQNGSIYWDMSLGAIPVNGNIQTDWATNGWEAGPLGYPIAGPNCGLATANGCFQRFQGGTVYWSSATGAHFIRNPMLSVWAQTGWEAGWLGYPTTDVTCGLRNGGCFEHFQKDASIYWTPATGAVIVNGAIRTAWSAQGWEAGAWGYPTANAKVAPGGLTQQFQGGTATWDSTTGQVTFQ